MSYVLPVATQGYKAGTELRDVTLREARAMECNRCGGCCSGLLPDDVVRKDPDTGLPRFIWGSKMPEDLYESRYGQRMLQPIGFLDEFTELPYQGRIGVVDDFPRNAAGQQYSCFSCVFFRVEDELGVCGLIEQFPNPDPKQLEQIRPLNCGEFPVFSSAIDDTLIGGHAFVPATGDLPKCTWHGLRITGPYRDEPYWRERWEKQQRDEFVPELKLPEDWVLGLEAKAAARRQQ